MDAAPIAPCPICGTPTEGIHIAGTVYDHVCADCAVKTDQDFRWLVNAVVDAVMIEDEPSVTDTWCCDTCRRLAEAANPLNDVDRGA